MAELQSAGFKPETPASGFPAQRGPPGPGLEDWKVGGWRVGSKNEKSFVTSHPEIPELGVEYGTDEDFHTTYGHHH